MKIAYKKAQHPRFPSTPSYSITATLIGRNGDPDFGILLGYVSKGHWGRGPHDGVRWEFSDPDGFGHQGPFANAYPDTLTEAKDLVSIWIMRQLAETRNSDPLPIDQVRHGYLALPKEAKELNQQPTT